VIWQPNYVTTSVPWIRYEMQNAMGLVSIGAGLNILDFAEYVSLEKHYSDVFELLRRA